jgi:hypothetical protein
MHEVPMADSTTAPLIQQAIAQLAQLDHEALADTFRQLLAAEPVRWRRLLLFAGFWPEPSRHKNSADAQRLSKPLACLMKTLQAMLEHDMDYVDAVVDMLFTLQGISFIQSYYGDIVDELKKLEFGKAPPSVQIHRLVAFVESQSRTMQQKLIDLQREASLYDPLTGHAATVSSKVDSSKASLGQAYDMLCENVELGLRLILHSHNLPAAPTFQSDHVPFNDPDIAKFIALAGVWRMATEAWANTRFRGWRWSCGASGHYGCFPEDNTAYIREQAGGIRYQMFVGQRILQSADDMDLAAYLDRLNKLAQSITIPQASESWSGEIDVAALRDLCSLAPLKAAVEEYVDQRHYGPMVDRVVVGSLGWHEWCDGKAALYCLADAISLAATAQLPDDDLSCMRQVLVVRDDTLASILVACDALSFDHAVEFVNALRFDPQRKSLEIWDQPLIPCGERVLFLVPTLIKSGTPARALENFVSQWGGASFDLRGTPFEDYIVAGIHDRSTARAQSGIEVQLKGGAILEFDIVVWWEGYLLLIEAKCQKAVFSAADYHRADVQIGKAINQLIVRNR